MKDDEINRLVAEKVFNEPMMFALGTCSDFPDSVYSVAVRDKEHLKEIEKDPCYEAIDWKLSNRQDLDDYLTPDGMMKVLEQMREDDYWYQIFCLPISWSFIIMAYDNVKGDYELSRQSHKSLPHAVALAALRAKGVDV